MHKLTLICFSLQSIIIIIQLVPVGCDKGALEKQPTIRTSPKLHQAAKIVNSGLDFAKKCSLTSMRVKAAIIAGRAVYKGIQTYKESGDLTKAGKAASEAGLQNAIDVVMCIRGVKIVKLGVNVLNDFKNNASWGTILVNVGTETFDLLPMGKHARTMSMKTAQALRNGKSMKEAVTGGFKEIFPNQLSTQPVEEKIFKPSETKEKVKPMTEVIVEDDENKIIMATKCSAFNEAEEKDEFGENDLNSLSMSGSEIITAMTGIHAVRAIQEGKSVKEIIVEGFDGTLLKDSNKRATVKDLIELWENREKTLREEKIRTTNRISKIHR